MKKNAEREFDLLRHTQMKSKNKKQISLSVHPFVNQKLCSPFVEHFDPRGAKSSKRRPKKSQRHPKRAPESFQDRRCDQRNPEMVSKRGPGTPEAPQRPARAKKTPLGVPKGPSWGVSAGVSGAVLYCLKQLFLHDFRIHPTEKQKIY